MTVLGAPVSHCGNLAFFVAFFSEMIRLSAGVGPRPVSYTHLDVYKRQLVDIQSKLQAGKGAGYA